MNRFTLTIELGNETMRTSNDVAAALHSVASYLRGSGDWADIDAGNVRDENGNVVGHWSVGDDDPLGNPPEHLRDAWERYQHGGRVQPYELRALDEWRADVAEADGY